MKVCEAMMQLWREIDKLGTSRTLTIDESNEIAVWVADSGMRTQFQLTLDKEISTSGRIHPIGARDESVGERLRSLAVVKGDDA